ncbi:CHASE2 and HATPase_c domain-containing protein [Paraburkholderia sp. DHOC27]|uniref:CHASE2 and HATPase_c domain-containing protein n=1 Tax=Paraburkholderia sp. DHOC27 TaxID=2303330 RepID=UPI00216AF793|nr:CHASE2 and HATPase_c domain-containing protein [Paraburkholderia sp. DHOC27]
MSLDPRARLGQPAGRRFLLEWAAIGCLGITVILAIALGHVTAGVDHLVYDRLLMLHRQTVSPDIVVVEIDNASIAQLGRWPWPRSVHARLLERLAQASPAAVIYDVLFTEPSPDDAQLAHAVALSPTYLPVLLSPESGDGTRVVVKPVAPLAQAAAGLGHINFEVDDDGIVRSVALFEGDAASRWPQLMLPVWRALRDGAVRVGAGPERGAVGDGGNGGGAGGGEVGTGTGNTAVVTASAVTSTDRLASRGDEARFLIPFSLNAGHYTKVSFASVLAGDVPPLRLRGRLVLVGVTAAGLYDRFATPVSGELGPMPGVYIHANVLDTLLGGRAIEPVGAWPLMLVSLLPLAGLLAGFLVLSPRRSLLLTAGLGAVVIVGSAGLLYGARLWMSPVPAIVGLIVVYPIWNWRRLEMTMAYLRKELQRLADEPHLLPETPQRRREFGGDVLAQHMALMGQAAQRVQDMKRFVWDSLDSVPEPLLVSDVHGVILIANHAAKAHFERLGEPPPQGRLVREALGTLAFVKTIDGGAERDVDRGGMAGATGRKGSDDGGIPDGDAPDGNAANGNAANGNAANGNAANGNAATGNAANGNAPDGNAPDATGSDSGIRNHDQQARAHWPAILDPTRREFASLMAQGIEVRDRMERDHLLRYALCANEQGEVTGWIAGLVDVSVLHAAERQREDALRLLSHDMRSPQASILALVEIERARLHRETGPANDLLERIARYSRRALTLADDFVQLARAESQTYVLEPVSLTELIIDASDEVWPQAHAKQIQLETEGGDEDGCWICADRSLMTRALVNILNNAVKYSPPGTRITCVMGTLNGAASGALNPAPSGLADHASDDVMRDLKDDAASASSNDTTDAMRHATSNATGNATRHTTGNATSDATSHVMLDTVSKPPARVQCTIRDQGYGIPVEQQSRLFQRFSRFHEGEQPETGGAGLGMAFVKTVVTRHGGDVHVVSAPGKGTEFTVILPALDEAQWDAVETAARF